MVKPRSSMLPIVLRGARTNNLKDVSLTLEPGTLVALTGPSGSGKSSLALETFHAEGQRRFIESFSPYARQFLERRERPPVEALDPIAATVAVDRRAPVKSSRSTLATLADLEPYLAALFGAESMPMCLSCNCLAVRVDPRKAADALRAEHDGARAIVSYRERASSTEQFLELRERLLKEGYRRLLVGGDVRDLDEVRPSEVTSSSSGAHVVLDRLTLGQRDTRRVSQALEAAWSRGARAYVHIEKDGRFVARPLARGLVCPQCAASFDEPRAALFSYNSPLGACGDCRGFGRVIGVDWDKVIPDPTRTLSKGAIKPWSGKSTEWERGALVSFCAKKGVPTDVPWGKLTKKQQGLVLEGEGTWTGGKFPGVRAWFKWLETRTYKMHVRVLLARYREYTVCQSCHGARLNERARAYRVAALSLGDWHALTIDAALARLDALVPKTPQGARAREHLHARLSYLSRVGLGYLTLDRQARTLSGGETQRAGLTTALGAKLTGTLFVVDEPSTGLHALDVPPLARAIRELATAGNTVLLVEHDDTLIDAADRVIGLGPGAGNAGGNIVYDGPAATRPRVTTPARVERNVRRVAKAESLVVTGASENNLRDVSVTIPRGALVAITGPSGSGKSTLAEDVIYRHVARTLGDTNVPRAGACESIAGADRFAKAVLVDQSPLGRTARGNTATYTKAWDRLRARFAVEPDAKKRKLTAAMFSFNVAGGRCDACNGEGCETVEMQFLADVQLVCPSCQGRRFKPKVLEAKLGGLDVAAVLALTVDEAIAKYCEGEYYDPVLRRALEPVSRVGLGYLPLGQPLSTLSGGEAQRLKLARALSESVHNALFVVDEPSAGLHPSDVQLVLGALRTLVDEGATVLCVEHDLDLIRGTDWIIDLGPGGGPHGGRVVAEGTLADIAAAGTKTSEALALTSAKGRAAALRARAKNEVAVAPVHSIGVTGAREHTLKNVSCEIPHGALTVITGPSGSGKSSLAFDVIFAEGQRRFMETLSPYARQFLPTLPRPDVDDVRGVPPSIALEQRISRAGANSTVSTVTEVAHYVRLLYAKVGDLHCPKCDTRVAVRSPQELYRELAARPKGDKSEKNAKYTLYAAAVRERKGTYLDVFTNASRAGIRTARVDGRIIEIEPPPRLVKSKEHSIDLIVHYGSLADLDRATFDRAVEWGEGTLRLAKGEPRAEVDEREELLSTARACPRCGTGVPEIDPRWFSWNTKQGQCAGCEGSGLEGGSDAPQPRKPCRVCHGERLSVVPRRVRLCDETYPAFSARSVKKALAAARAMRFTGRSAEIARAPHKELVRRLEFLVDVGLDYLALDRPASTLSGGEIQRLRLSAQLGSGLTGALYVLDEPTIGLHPRDTGRLLRNLRAITDAGSTVMVVEHDAETIRAADHVIDMGPGGGSHGGQIVCAGPAHEVLSSPLSPTARALSAEIAPRKARGITSKSRCIALRGAAGHNLQGVDVTIPHAALTVVCGVSGSGKSTLVGKVLYPALRAELGLVTDPPLAFDALEGLGNIKRAIRVDQSPIGRTPRSVPATFLGLWDDIRRLFAALPEAQACGYSASRFSFNTKGGRCDACEGQGVIVHEMSFLPDVASTCETCQGLRFEPNTLDIRYRDRSIGDVLKLTAEEAVEVFAAHPRIARPLRTVCDLGLGYLQIGQGSHTLSGGEAQRLKLAAELTAGAAHEPTVYVLDEPTTGLHVDDVARLLTVLDRLVERGDTLVVVEHHPDVIRGADWVIELGPEAGEDGGKLVFEGPPEKLLTKKTPTGTWLSRAPENAASRAKRSYSKKSRWSNEPAPPS